MVAARRHRMFQFRPSRYAAQYRLDRFVRSFIVPSNRTGWSILALKASKPFGEIAR